MPFVKNMDARMQILDIIDRYIIENEGLRPSVRKIAKLRGKSSTEPTHRMIKDLEGEGLLSRPSGEPFRSDWTLTTAGRVALDKWKRSQTNGSKP